ncbi:MAG: hypothetical protein KAT70_04715, partial [Thermoplasmata archaeon]|nr:hypothetical protein [Thermoplasmata archaeon]
MPLGKRLFATAFVTLMLTVFFVGLAEPADAVADTGTITLSGGEINLDVQPGSSAAVAIPGTVEMVGMSYQVTITLSASSLLGAAASVSPSAIVLPQGETMGSFTVMVKERIGTSYTSADVITVSGTWTSGKGTSGTLPATEQQIYIKQFYRITVSSEQPYVEVSPGDQVFFPMKIENMGNGQDTFVVKVEEENLKSLADAGWTVQIGTPKIVVEELQHKPTTITATTPMGSTIWKND